MIIAGVVQSGSGLDQKRSYRVRDTGKPYRETPNEFSPGVAKSGGILVTDPDTGSYVDHFRGVPELLGFLSCMRFSFHYHKPEGCEYADDHGDCGSHANHDGA